MPEVHRSERAELAEQLAECCRRLRLLTEARRLLEALLADLAPRLSQPNDKAALPASFIDPSSVCVAPSAALFPSG
jgi:hypothetical protein